MGAKYLKGPVTVHDGTIELIKTINRPKKGKGSEVALSAKKRIYQICGVQIESILLLSRFAVITRTHGILTRVASTSGDTDLLVQYTGVRASIALISGTATYQSLKNLGLAKYIIEKE